MTDYHVKVKVSSLFFQDVHRKAEDLFVVAEEDLERIGKYVTVLAPVDEALKPIAEKIKATRKSQAAAPQPAAEIPLGTITVDTPVGDAVVDVVTDIQP